MSGGFRAANYYDICSTGFTFSSNGAPVEPVTVCQIPSNELSNHVVYGSSLIRQYPKLAGVIGSLFLSSAMLPDRFMAADNVPTFEPLTFVRDGGRTGSWTDWRIPIALKDIGVPRSKLNQEFFLNVKGLGGLITADSITALRRPDLQYLTHPSIPEALREHLLILWHNMGFVRPFGGQIRYQSTHESKIRTRLCSIIRALR